tara:strand:- start:3418 stop:4149 length:732 start_codon:yes stop_codon:yes gene_type:complete
MALKASASGGGEYEAVPKGTHNAVCYRLIDAGTREEQFKEEDPKKRHVIFIQWELPDLKLDDGRPMSIMKQYTLSLNENSTLHKDLKMWRGKSFTDEELRGFDLTAVLGVNCELEVGHTANGRAKVTSVFKPTGGFKKMATANPLTAFDLDVYCAEFSGDSTPETKAMCDIYEDLPNFMKEMIDNSFEMRAAMAKGERKRVADAAGEGGGLAAIATMKANTEAAHKEMAEADDGADLDDPIPF